LVTAKDAYLEGNKMRGAHIVQDIQDSLFPERLGQRSVNDAT
jgi:hypothetical protein